MKDESIDLVYEICKLLNLFSQEDETFERSLKEHFPNIDQQTIHAAYNKATELKKATFTASSAFYHEPHGTVHQKVKEYFRTEFPDLSKNSQSWAIHKTMFIIIK